VPTNASVAPYLPGAWPYFTRALTWARAHGIHVLVDLHGAPGSQNGYDNSGQRTGNPQWALDAANVNQTLDVLRVLASEAGAQLDAIELLNEGAGFLGTQWAATIRQYFTDGYEVVRDAAGSSVKVFIGDAFLGVDVRSDCFVRCSVCSTFAELAEFFAAARRAGRHDGLRPSIPDLYPRPSADCHRSTSTKSSVYPSSSAHNSSTSSMRATRSSRALSRTPTRAPVCGP
jgi:hypothetical protein